METDGTETVADYVETEKLHQEKSLEGQFLFLETKINPKLPKVFCVWFIIFFP